MTRSILELARRMQELDYDGVNFYALRRAEKDLIAAYPKIIELCEALEGLIQKLDAVHADPKYMTVWRIAQLHQGPYDGPKYTDEFARARRALNGE